MKQKNKSIVQSPPSHVFHVQRLELKCSLLLDAGQRHEGSMIGNGHQPVNVSPTLKTITCVSPIEGELFALKASIDQVDDRALDTQRQIVAGTLFIYMTVWFSLLVWGLQFQ